MKIQCDVCSQEEASVFCSADEAALCDGCDRRVHDANKLASKHLRFSLLRLSFKDFPRCDICQDRRAFLFCQEDRAIICRECDIPIHKANEHTQKHSRFLLTGIKLSASSSYHTPSSSYGSSAGTETEADIKNSASNEIFKPNSTEKSVPSTPCKVDDHCTTQEGSVSTSSISEYLMETLPGWRVEDFLDPSCYPYGFCQTYNHTLPSADHDLESTYGSFPSEDLVIWVPQSCHLPGTGVINGPKGSEEVNSVMKISRKWSEYGYKVPHISPPSIKRSRQCR